MCVRNIGHMTVRYAIMHIIYHNYDIMTYDMCVHMQRPIISLYFIEPLIARTQMNQMLDDKVTSEIVSPDFLLSLGHQSTEESHRLLHESVHGRNYTEAKLDFASKYVQKVFETLVRRQRDNVLRFLAASAEAPALAILRGRMFESHCHEPLSQSTSLKARKLVKRHATQPKD